MPYADPVILKTYKQQWAEKNREKMRASRRAYEEANRDKIRAYRAGEVYQAYKKGDAKKRYLNPTLLEKKKRILNGARYNARNRNIEFSLTVSDLIWPDVCPVLGIKLNYGGSKGRNSPDSPSLDRTDHTLGYVKGNVVVMSWRANKIKTDVTNEEARLLLGYLNRIRSN